MFTDLDEYLTGLGYTTTSLNGKAKAFLEFETSSVGNITDLGLKYLVSQGFTTGHINDRFLGWLKLTSGKSSGSYNDLVEVLNSPVLGPELQVNFDMSQGLQNWAPVGAAILTAISDEEGDAVEVSTTATGVSRRGKITTDGMVIGKNYRITIRVKRGASDGTQLIGGVDWGTTSFIEVNNTAYQTFTLDVTNATAVSGTTSVYAGAPVTNLTDTTAVTSFSVKELL